MKVDYTFTLADYQAALKLHSRGKVSRRIWYLLLLWIGPAIAIVFLLFVLVTTLLFRTEFTAGSLATLGFVLFLILIPVMHFRNVHKRFKQSFPNGRTEQQVSFDIDEERIISVNPGVSEGKYFWNSILDFAHDDKVNIFYVGKSQLLIVPTHALTPAQCLELTDLVMRKLKRGPNAN